MPCLPLYQAMSSAASPPGDNRGRIDLAMRAVRVWSTTRIGPTAVVGCVPHDFSPIARVGVINYL